MTNKYILFRQKMTAALLLATAAAAIAFGLSAAGWLDELEWKSFDLRVRLSRTETPPPPEIALILIDEASLRMMNVRVGHWPWPRALHADVVDFLAAAGARRIVFDVLFTENERNVAGERAGLSENDARLASAVASAGNVVSAAQLIRDEADEYNRELLNRPLPPEFVQRFALPGLNGVDNHSLSPNNAYLPFDELLNSSYDIGVVEFSPDRDGIYRRTRLTRTYGEYTFSTLVLASMSDRWQPQTTSDHSLPLISKGKNPERIELPLDSDGEYLIKPYKDFFAYSMSGVLVSIHQIMPGEIDHLPVNPEEFRNKIVLIGASAVGVDLKPTPFGTLQPGVFLHASIIGNILHRDFLHTPPVWLKPVTTLFLPLWMALAVLLPTRTIWRIFASIALTLLFLAAGQCAFEAQWVVEMVTPWTGMALAWIGSFARLSATEGREKRRIRKMFGQYVSPAVLDSIAENVSRGLLQAEVGRREHLTILFSDIRGFTSLSEVMEPEQVVEILNGYFTGMVDIIFLRQGILDKFIGDAIMAFGGGAPLRIDNHALQGVTAALEMARWLEIYNKTLRQRGLPPLEIGIGLHTGPVILGNIGSEKKLDYTVIGDNVNLSSRLEGLTKSYPCKILISETTEQEVGEKVVCRILDHVRVKGKTQPICIYEVLSLATDAEPVQTLARKQAELTATAFERYLARDWAGAITDFANTETLRSDGLTANQPEHVDIYGATLSLTRFTRSTSTTLGLGYSFGRGEAQVVDGSTAIQHVEVENLNAFLSAAYSF